jgi:predicted peptidase
MVQGTQISGVMRTGQHACSSKVQTETTSGTRRTVTVNYLLYLPDAYVQASRRKWPLILFLHGSDERGKDLELLTTQPLPKMLAQQADFPFIVVSPQLPLARRSWSDRIEPLNRLLDRIASVYAVDRRRVYLTGISLGAFGAWEFALRYPNRFAAIVPIAGGYKYQRNTVPENICDLKDIPIWVFHGGSDTTIRPNQSQILVDALKACGSKVRFTLYPGVDHVESWTRAYADPGLYKWLLKQKLE